LAIGPFIDLTCFKFKLTEREIQYLLCIKILPYCTVVTAKAGAVIIKEDPSDDIFLRCCEVASAKTLISGIFVITEKVLREISERKEGGFICQIIQAFRYQATGRIPG